MMGETERLTSAVGTRNSRWRALVFLRVPRLDSKRGARLVIRPHVRLAVPDTTVLAHAIACPAGNRYVIYSPAVLGNPTDHLPDKWYFSHFPMTPGIVAGEAFDTAADAEAGALLVEALLG